ncbi:MAG: transporter [Bacteroidales bacterium]|nr:transporter [Bacteroidales bacterium]
MYKILLAITILIVVSQTAKTQELVTDRPDQTESSSTVTKNSLQIEAGVLYGNEAKNTRTQILMPTTLFRFGLTDIIELRLGEQIEFNENKLNSSSYFGISDLELGTKIQIFKKQDVNIEIAFLSHLILPTGSDSITNNKFGAVNKFAFSHILNDNFSIGYNLGYNYFGFGKGDITYSTVLGISFSDKLGFYIETYGELSDIKDFKINFDTGLTYLFKPNLQFDLSYGAGLNENLNYFALGFSWNIN